MRWVANRHLDDEQEAASNGWKRDSKCNPHSWLVKYPCCYSDRSDGECMWNKPYELSGWDNRQGFEITVGPFGGTMTPDLAMQTWRDPPSHYNLIMTQGGWTDLKTVGCAYRKSTAHCWFAKEKY